MFWRSVWMLFLPCEMPPVAAMAPVRRAPGVVYGAAVEAVIGPGARIESVVSTLRPWTNVRRVTAFAPPDNHHRGGQDATTPGLAYVADGAEEPQTLFAPFYVSTEAAREHAHGTALRPASRYALRALPLASPPKSRMILR